jgi:hypothetical protein
MKRTNLPFQLCSTLSVNLTPSGSYSSHRYELLPGARSNTKKRANSTQKTRENYAVKFPERAERLINSSGRFPERLFQISAFKARTECIKTMVWRSKHNQPLKQNSQESEISPTCRRCGQSNETMTHLFEDWPHPESLRARSRALQKLFEEAQIEPRTWEEMVTRNPNPGVTSFLEKVFMTLYTRF